MELKRATEGTVEIAPIGNGRNRVTLNSADPALFIPVRSCETTLSPELIERIAQISFPWVCDTLNRHNYDGYVMEAVRGQLLAYFDHSAFAGKRILDFGCGSAASTLGMAALFPDTEIVGVDLVARNIELGRTIQEFRKLHNVKLLVSPDGNSLPAGIGQFDFVMMSAVFEHLLPVERKTVMPLVWSHLKPGGALFINQTPYRWFPYEHHSTGLWGINYLPDSLAYRMAASFTRGVKHGPEFTWEDELRGGIRGGTEWEVLSCLRGEWKPVVIQPKTGDRASYWLSSVSPRHAGLKRAVAGFFRLCDRTLGTVPSMNLDMVVRKTKRA